MVLTTGNKSETAVGYSTLYGDTAGGFAVIKDVPKTLVYKLSRYVNELHGREVIPVSVIERPPSAELREDQKDDEDHIY
jgi:NAD+ synthase (glutamine-hydrolysing)